MTTPAQKKLALLAWIAVCLIWGTTYLGIAVSLESMPPALMDGFRWTIAGLLLGGFVIARGERLPPPSRWGGILLMAFLLLGLGNGGVVFAEQWVPSGLAAVMVATSPFWMAAVEAGLRDGEKLRAKTVAGLLIGFSGILVLVWPDLTLDTGNRRFLAGVIALQIASLGWALGSAYSRRHARNDNILATTALQMLAGGLMMLVAATALGEWQKLFFTARTGAALAYLATIGAVGGFVAYTYALRHLSVSFVSLYAYINPVIAVALGVLLLNEPFDWRMATAAALVFAGVTVVRWGKGSGDAPTRDALRPVSMDVAVPRNGVGPGACVEPRTRPAAFDGAQAKEAGLHRRRAGEPRQADRGLSVGRRDRVTRARDGTSCLRRGV